MSDFAATLFAPAKVDRRAVRDTPIYPPRHPIAAAQGVHGEYVPLSQRSSDQLLARAEELRRMAQTATTTDVARALLTLADRYSALAAKRVAEAVT
jgi:hypothetical protein